MLNVSANVTTDFRDAAASIVMKSSVTVANEDLLNLRA